MNVFVSMFYRLSSSSLGNDEWIFLFGKYGSLRCSAENASHTLFLCLQNLIRLLFGCVVVKFFSLNEFDHT